MALTGGFPEPVLRLAGTARSAWLDAYVDQLVTRDAEGLAGVRNPMLLRRYFEALLTDPALVTAALRLDAGVVLRDGNLLGRMIDTFVLSQIRPEAELSPLRPRLYHLRDERGAMGLTSVARVSGR